MKVYNDQIKKPLNEQLVEILKEIRKKRAFDAKTYIQRKVKLLNDYMRKFGLKACVVGVSGGIDSAIVLGILKKAADEKNSPIERIVPMLLPVIKSIGVTNQMDATERGKEWCNKLGIAPHIVDLTKINDTIRESLEGVVGIEADQWAIGQLGPYSRTPVLYYTTSLLTSIGLGAVVCGTINTDEGAYLGYLGKASDGMVDLQMISDIHKSEVYQVAEYLGVPDSIKKVVPNGDMYDNRTDEMVFGAPYDFVEIYLTYLKYTETEKKQLIDKLTGDAYEQFQLYANNLEKLHRYNAHKYISKSPAVHMDLWDSSIKGGWENYYKVLNRLMNK